MSSEPLISTIPIIVIPDMRTKALKTRNRVGSYTGSYTGSSTDLATWSQFADARAGRLKARLGTGHSVGVRWKPLDAVGVSTVRLFDGP